MSLAISSQTEPTHSYEHLAGPIDENQSNEARTVLSGQNLAAGTVVGSVDLGIGGGVAVLSGTSPGNGTMTDIFAGPDVQAGAYLVQCTAIATHGGTFSVTAPDGTVLPPITMTAGAGVATNYTSTHINFTLTDGSGDFALTALFTVTFSTTAPVVLGGTGTGVMTALALGPDAQTGRYLVINRAVVANGGDFEVIAPDGSSIGRFPMGTASTETATFTSRHISFTLSDATDYILNNRFNIAVFKLAAARKVVAWDPTPATFDGRHKVCGVLKDAVDASAADAPGVVTVRGPVTLVASKLAWLSGMGTAEKATGRAALAALGMPAI